MKACILFTSDNEVAEDWLGKFDSREPLDIYGQKYLIDEISTDYEPGFAGVTIKMYPVYQAKSPERPKKQEAWNGEGLPPVGTVCDMHIDDFGWITGTVVVHIDLDEPTAVAHNGEEVFHGNASDFRPIKTAEQVASEDREKAIEEMVFGVCGCEPDGGNTSAFMVCGFLYDAGYRKQ